MTLNDETEIVHSEMLPNGKVKVYIEKPDADDCFHHATCYLPEYEWTEVTGFTEEEMQKYKEIVESPIGYISGRMRTTLWSLFMCTFRKENQEKIPRKYGSQNQGSVWSRIITLKYLRIPCEILCEFSRQEMKK